MKNSRNKHFTVLNRSLFCRSVVKSRAIPPWSSQNVNHPFVQFIHTVFAPRPLVSQQAFWLSDRQQKDLLLLAFVWITLILLNEVLKGKRCAAGNLNMATRSGKLYTGLSTIHAFRHPMEVLERILGGWGREGGVGGVLYNSMIPCVWNLKVS